MDISTIAGNSEILNIEREFSDLFFRYEQQISLKELNEKIKKEYPTLQEQKMT